jgi:hypothetical protein
LADPARTLLPDHFQRQFRDVNRVDLPGRSHAPGEAQGEVARSAAVIDDGHTRLEAEGLDPVFNPGRDPIDHGESCPHHLKGQVGHSFHGIDLGWILAVYSASWQDRV